MAVNNTRFRLCFIAMGLTLLAIVLSGITVGPADITWRDTASALLAGIARLLDRIDGLPITEAVSWQDTIIWQVRLPRVLVAVFVGAALATSGAVLQGLFPQPTGIVRHIGRFLRRIAGRCTGDLSGLDHDDHLGAADFGLCRRHTELATGVQHCQ
jgi:ABC-type enterobactin transport system permease subunit